jgi:hypothetical protein
MTDTSTPDPLDFGGPDEGGLTDAEKLAALGTYLKVLGGTERELRTAVTDDMGKRHVEKVGAYLPDGTKMASVARSDGKRTVKINEDAALKWCAERYPDEVVTVQMVRPAFLKKLADIAGSLPVGSKGLDSATGEELDFVEVMQGSPYVTVTTTPEGVARMETLAHGFARMLERPATIVDPPKPGVGSPLKTPAPDEGVAKSLALHTMLTVLDDWIEGAQHNHEAMGHRGENVGDECWRSFAPEDIRNMVNDAAREVGITEFDPPTVRKEEER